MNRSSAAIAMLSIATTTACFAGYDSRWGQSASVQRQHAAQNAPTLHGENPESKDAASARREMRALHVRALVAHAYTTQISDVPATLRELFADANDVLEPALGVTLTLEGIRTWNLAKDDDLVAVLRELRAADSASDTGVDWVAGFVGALPRATASFHDLGYGDIPGRHIVLRAPSSAQQHDALERSYGELNDDERRRLQKEHRRHRVAAAFLHEIGHTLGALHERSESMLMFPGYRMKMRSFGPETIAIMRGVLAKRDSRAVADQAAVLREITNGVRAAPNVFFEEEREKLLPQIEAQALSLEASLKTNEATSKAAAVQDAKPEAKAKPPSELTTEDQSRYSRARDLASKGEHAGAWETAKPLYAAYPDVLAVQDLRCTLATNVFRFEQARKECDRLMQLSTGRTK